MIDPYFAEEIERVWSFLQTRRQNPELLVKMAVLLDESDQSLQASEWYAEVKTLNLPDEQIEQLNQKIRQQYNFAMVPVVKSEAAATEADTGQSADADTSPDAIAIAAEEYLKLFRHSKKADYLALAAERYLWDNQSHKALPLLVQLQKMRPGDRKLLLQLAEISSWHGDSVAAANYLEKALAKKYHRSLQQKLIFALYAIPDHVRTEAIARQYLQKYPDDARIKGFLAQLLLELNRTDEALALIETVNLARLATLQLEGFLPVIFARRDFKRVQQFCRQLEKRKIAPLTRLKTSYFRAAALLEEKHYQAAEEPIGQADRMLRSNKLKIPADQRLRFNLDFMLLKAAIAKELPQQKGLVELYKKILELNPQQFDALVFLGEDLRSRGDLSRARKMFARALEISPDDRYLLWTLADIAHRTGNIYRARLLMEKLAALPEFKDEALLLELWQKTSSWKKLADYIAVQHLLPEYETFYLEALLNLGHYAEAAAILLRNLQTNPFDEIAEQRFKKIAGKVPDLWQSYLNSKNQLIDSYHENLVASISREITGNPLDKNLLRQRATVRGYMNQPLRALQDLNLILSENPGDVKLLEESAGLAEWGGDSAQAWKIRNHLAEVAPENASNAVALSSLAFARRQFGAAEKWRKYGSSLQHQQPRQYFYSAMPVLLQAGKYAQARRLLEETRKTLSGYPEDKAFSRFFQENARMLSRDYGPVCRLGFNFLHDTDNVSLTSLNFSSRFRVRDNSLLQLSAEDLAMTRTSNNQRGVRSRDIRFSLNRNRAEDQLAFSLPMLLQNAEKVRLFMPGVSYRQLKERHELGFNLSQLPLRDTPEALRQGLFSNNAELTFRKKMGDRTWVQGNAGFKKNSAGYSGTFAGFSIDKAISFAPFRSLRYSFATEDNQSENSDIFYLEDFIQTHTFAWSGQSDFFHAGRFFDMINWDVFAGINNRSETFHGASVRFERPLKSNCYLSAFASYYASENNRFAQVGGYENWNYGLAVEMREW